MKDNDGWTRSRYKAWAVAIILLLALWSMLSGSAGVANTWSVAYNRFAGSLISASHHDNVDPLELELREKLVRENWDKYKFSRSKPKLNTFWHDAFEAAFEDMESENPSAFENAVHEIAKLSVYVFELDPITGKPKA